MKIIPKISLLIIAAILLIMGGVGFFLIRSTQNVLNKQIDLHLTEHIDMVKKEILNISENIKGITKTLSHHPFIRKALFLQQSRGINRILNDTIQIYPFYNYIMIVDSRGDVFAASTRDALGNKIEGEQLLGKNIRENIMYSQALLKETVTGNIGIDPYLRLIGLKRDISQWFITPVIERGEEARGWVVVSYDWGKEISLMLHEVETGLREEIDNTAEVLLVDDKGEIIVENSTVVNVSGFSSERLYKEDILEFGNSRIKLVISYNKEEIDKPAIEMRNYLIAIGLLITILLSLLLSLILHKTILKRLNILHKGTDEMIKGELQYRLPETGDDEISDLAKAFNHMGESLHNTLGELTYERDFVRNIIKSMIDTLVVATPEARIISVNQAICNLLGYSEKELTGQPMNILFAEEELELKDLGLNELLTKGFISNVEKIYMSKEGRKIPVLFSGALMLDNEGDVQGIVCAAQDITDLKRAEEKLRKTTVSRDYMDNIIHSMINMLIVVTPEAVIQTVNQAACHILGYNEEELIGRSVSMVFAEEENGGFKAKWFDELVERGSVSNVERTYISKGGKDIAVLFSGSVMPDGDGGVQGVVFVAQDITVIKQMEEEARVKEINMLAISKLATLGEVATGIAHEINQPLAYISGFIQNLEIAFNENKVKPEKVKEKLKRAYKQVGRITDIIQHLRTFGRKDRIKSFNEEIVIEEVLNNTLLIMGERIRLNNIQLTKRIAEDLPVFKGNANQMEQVFINLFQNAIDAVSSIKEAEIKINMYYNKGALITEFSDNGKGIDKELQSRIFDPFFTTKEVGQGTGLGLSIVHGIVEEHNGIIACESEVGKGTTFKITIHL